MSGEKSERRMWKLPSKQWWEKWLKLLAFSRKFGCCCVFPRRLSMRYPSAEDDDWCKTEGCLLGGLNFLMIVAEWEIHVLQPLIIKKRFKNRDISSHPLQTHSDISSRRKCVSMDWKVIFGRKRRQVCLSVCFGLPTHLNGYVRQAWRQTFSYLSSKIDLNSIIIKSSSLHVEKCFCDAKKRLFCQRLPTLDQ